MSVWIAESAFAKLSREADMSYPFETGGILVGYIADNNEYVVQVIIGPGIKATHRRNSFLPDHEWQCGELDRIFAQSGGVTRYLGDWHTHPDSSPQMSWRDRRTLAAIAKHPKTGLPRPLMLIGGGAKESRLWLPHQYAGRGRFGTLTKVVELRLKCFLDF